MATGPALLIAGPSSGVGKTTIALSLMQAFRKRGLTVQPFKCGPDFIDGPHHTRLCGRRSRNLDAWMLSSETNRAIFSAAARTADLTIVEGMMGLFDGVDSSGAGSTAALARELDLPVVLVIDASKMAASVAALVRGFATFDPAVRIVGVLFNQVGSAGHFQLLAEALAVAGCPPALGYVPSDPLIQIPERHLGLCTADEEPLSRPALDHLGSLVERCVDLDRVWTIASAGDGDEIDRRGSALPSRIQHAVHQSARIAVARDRAFCFYYEDNLDALARAGADIIEFSPLTDRTLPAHADAIYLGGGYPELWAAELSANDAMRTAVSAFAARGGPVYAECGGLMYLGTHLRLLDGTSHPMAGVLPFGTALTDHLVRFGYTEICLTADCLIGSRGTTARGHSFHFSTIEGHPGVDCVYRVRSSHGGPESAEGYVTGSVLASYVHLHFLSNPELSVSFVRAASRWRAHGTVV